MDTLVCTAESLFEDSFPAQFRAEREAVEHRARARRRAEREAALTEIQFSHMVQCKHFAEAEQALAAAAGSRLALDPECECATMSELDLCGACNDEAAVRRHSARAQAWLDASVATITSVDPNGHLAGTARPRALPEEAYVMEWVAGEQRRVMLDPEEYITVGEDIVLMPTFRPIDYQALKPRVRTKLDRLVSYAPNWAREVEEWYTTDLYSTPGKRERYLEISERALLTLKKRWVYPGRHLIGREADGFRVAVLTVFVAERGQWAVYCCLDAGRDQRNFTRWQPFEWTLIDLDPTMDAGLPDGEQPSLDLALAVAAKRARQLRAEWGQVDEIPGSPLPFSMDRLATMADAIQADLERKRPTADSGPAQ